MSFTFAITVTFILVLLIVLSFICDNEEFGALFAFLFFFWLVFGMVGWGNIMPNPAYPTEYFNVMVTGAADIPSGGFILFYDKEIYNATEQRFMAISDLPLRDKKEVVFQVKQYLMLSVVAQDVYTI